MGQGRHRPARRAAICAMVLCAGACRDRADAPPPPSELRYDGATTISARVIPALAPTFQARTGVRLAIERSGAGVGLRRALAGEVDVAGVSRSLGAAELAKKPYFQIIGYDAIAVFVNDANPVRDLTRAQLKAVFTGSASSWKDLGGKATRIVPCTERAEAGRAIDPFRALALGGAEYGKVAERDDPADCLALVAEEPGGIAAASVSYTAPGVRVVSVDSLEPLPVHVRAGRYPLTRPLVLVARQPPQGPLAALFELALSPEGQAAIANAGFVPAR